MKHGRILAIALPLALVAVSCGDDQGVSDSTVPESDSDQEIITDSGPLYLGLSIHVEGWDQEAQNQDMFDVHTAGLLDMAETAAAGGAVLTFEFGEPYLDGVIAWDSDVIERLTALGHGTGVHADVGGRGDPSLEELVEDLTRMRDKAGSIGIDTRHVSGVCSRGPWVEAVLQAGFQSTNGAVEYCATSLDPEAVPDDWDLSECTSPAACHGRLQVDLEARIHPYLVDSAADFLTPADEGLVLMIGNSGEAVDCASEQQTGGGCTGTAEDLPFAADLLAEFLENRDPSRVASLTMSWSVGSIPRQEFVADLVAVFADAVASGDAMWMANAEIGEAVLTGPVAVAVEAAPAQASGDPLPVVVSIHSHLARDYEPYTSPAMTSLDERQYDALVALITETAAELDARGILANWQMSYGVATALCTEDTTGVVEGLVAAGHEIGVHLHPLGDLGRVLDGLDTCGITPTTVSGLAFTTGSGSPAEAEEAAAEWLASIETAGFDTVLVSLGDGTNPLDIACGTYAGADYVEAAGALLRVWTADADDPCGAAGAGSLQFVTHASVPLGTRPGAGGPRNPPIGPEHAEAWGDWLDAAIDLAGADASWGLVMPLPSMGDADGASDGFIDGFGAILDDIADAVEAGQVVSLTAAEF